jgi:hypothetical protein
MEKHTICISSYIKLWTLDLYVNLPISLVQTLDVGLLFWLVLLLLSFPIPFISSANVSARVSPNCKHNNNKIQRCILYTQTNQTTYITIQLN